MTTQDPFSARASLSTGAGALNMYRLDALEKAGLSGVDRLPFSIKIMLEQALRQLDGFQVTEEDVRNIATWKAAAPGEVEIPFKPSRVVLQDFTGVPAIVDLAALRSAMQRLGGDPKRINPQVPVDLVIDHSVQVDRFGSSFALMFNADREFERNRERYEFLRWGTEAFDNFRVVPPATGIVHQVNLEYLATVVEARNGVAFPDTLVGTDSHTTMINGLGVVGWGVGGIEAEAAMLGQPMYMLLPEVIGFKLTGALPQGATATDLVLTVTQMLRKKGVVNKFVEFYGAGLSSLTLADRATIANMAPEYGATIGYFPVDAETLNYMRSTGRSAEVVDRTERYCKEQGLFRTDATPDPLFTDTLSLDLGMVEPSIAGPKRPQDRVALKDASASFHKAWSEFTGNGKEAKRVPVSFQRDGEGETVQAEVSDGSVVIAAITSCTNTSNPSVMVGAGLLARKAREKGLRVPGHVKTSLAPGSKVVTRYLDAAGLTPYLDELNFHTVGYGCTTCIGNSGPMQPEIEQAVKENNLVVAAVLSGNRNFEGRVHPATRTNYLASPPLVVAYALAGRMDLDLTTDPIGHDEAGNAVYLADIWPTPDEVRETIARALKPEMYMEEYGNVFTGNERWNAIPVAGGDLYTWDRDSTYIQEPPFFVGLSTSQPDITDIRGARCLALLGDSVTTDHISPAGDIALKSPAGDFLRERGVEKVDFNSYGSRRGNHEVMMRGTFANIRLKNQMLPGTEGGVAVKLPAGAGSAAEGQQMSIYDAAMKYQAEGTPLVIVAGQEYGTGSSRDWAAKGTYLLGVRAVIAESFERIHRSNLVFMGVLPLQFRPGENAKSLGLTGYEVYEISGLSNEVKPRQELSVKATRADGTAVEFKAICRIDTPVEVQYYRNSGILHTVLRGMLKG